MNSLFSTIENQQLLWEMINKTPLINVHFPPSHSDSHLNKEKWFLSILNTFHQKNPHVYKKDDLLQMNRSTLSFLMNDLKNKNSNMNNQLNDKTNQIETDLNSRYTRIEPRSNSYTNSYEERQKEYESMLQGVLPTPVQFEKIEDKKIQNITELTEQYRKSRELEVQIHPINHVKNPTDIKLTLHETIPENDIMDVLNIVNIKQTNTEKHIHWADSFTEISYLHEQIKLLKSRMDDFEKREIPIILSQNKTSTFIQSPNGHSVNDVICCENDTSIQVDINEIDDINNVVERIQKISFENTRKE
jgi:hypothetical protein